MKTRQTEKPNKRRADRRRGFLIRLDENASSFKRKHKRVWCEYENGMLSVYDERPVNEDDINARKSKYGTEQTKKIRQRIKVKRIYNKPISDDDKAFLEAQSAKKAKPRYRIAVTDSINVDAEPHNINESIAKMNLRKKKSRPYAMRLKFHCADGCDECISLAADAGGSIAPWLRVLAAGAWHPSLPPCSLHFRKEHDILLKLLLPKEMYSKSSTILSKSSPRALIFRGSAHSCTLNCLRNFISEHTGMPLHFASFFYRNHKLQNESASLSQLCVCDKTFVSVSVKGGVAFQTTRNKKQLGKFSWSSLRVLRQPDETPQSLLSRAPKQRKIISYDSNENVEDGAAKNTIPVDRNAERVWKFYEFLAQEGDGHANSVHLPDRVYTETLNIAEMGVRAYVPWYKKSLS